MKWLVAGILLFLCYLFMFALCKIAAVADRRTEELYKEKLNETNRFKRNQV